MIRCLSRDIIEPIPAFASPIVLRSARNQSSSFRRRAMTCSPSSSNCSSQPPRRIKRRMFQNFTRTLSNENLLLFDDNVLLEHGQEEPYHGGMSNGIGDHSHHERVRITSSSSSTIGLSSGDSSRTGRKQAPKWCLFESLDYDQCENMLQLQEETIASRKGLGKHLEVTRTTVIFVIGLLTALTACFIVSSIQLLCNYKYNKLMVSCFCRVMTFVSSSLFRIFSMLSMLTTHRVDSSSHIFTG